MTKGYVELTVSDYYQQRLMHSLRLQSHRLSATANKEAFGSLSNLRSHECLHASSLIATSSKSRNPSRFFIWTHVQRINKQSELVTLSMFDRIPDQ
jgi:hypothetical protein